LIIYLYKSTCSPAIKGDLVVEFCPERLCHLDLDQRKFQFQVSEKIFRNQPTRNKNCLWQPCLLTDGDEISNLYRGPSIDASYQVSVQLAKQFQGRRFLEIDQSGPL
jgi:hypothetical protein